ncbi:hypothetical protein [Alkalihalobacillus sp. LMS39]|nr:hypothetical protein [Alkalihalobacillus sp. LMS39]UOE93619.1 hypothetical protein MM271_20925 [Alkalihalobacillus sp. LMS39]
MEKFKQKEELPVYNVYNCELNRKMKKRRVPRITEKPRRYDNMYGGA